MYVFLLSIRRVTGLWSQRTRFLLSNAFLSRLDSRENFFTCAAAFFFPKGTGAPATGLNEGDAAAWYRATGKEGELPEFVKTDMAYICGDFDSFQKEILSTGLQ